MSLPISNDWTKTGYVFMKPHLSPVLTRGPSLYRRLDDGQFNEWSQKFHYAISFPKISGRYLAFVNHLDEIDLWDWEAGAKLWSHLPPEGMILDLHLNEEGVVLLEMEDGEKSQLMMIKAGKTMPFKMDELQRGDAIIFTANEMYRFSHDFFYVYDHKGRCLKKIQTEIFSSIYEQFHVTDDDVLCMQALNLGTRISPLKVICSDRYIIYGCNQKRKIFVYDRLEGKSKTLPFMEECQQVHTMYLSGDNLFYAVGNIANSLPEEPAICRLNLQNEVVKIYKLLDAKGYVFSLVAKEDRLFCLIDNGQLRNVDLLQINFESHEIFVKHSIDTPTWATLTIHDDLLMIGYHMIFDRENRANPLFVYRLDALNLNHPTQNCNIYSVSSNCYHGDYLFTFVNEKLSICSPCSLIVKDYSQKQ